MAILFDVSGLRAQADTYKKLIAADKKELATARD